MITRYEKVANLSLANDVVVDFNENALSNFVEYASTNIGFA